ncbi:relaxase/mobilization nuclease domain-containing protein, partial [Streptomyces alkaliterrae]
MIAKISSGKSTVGLIRYLYGPGRANEHTDLHVKQARRLGRAPERHVWHCSIRAANTDRHLDDSEWADIARRVVAATGIAPADDPDGCRWVAVRHAPDHIHIAATKIRPDLRTARHWNDYLTADRELAAIEKEYGLHQVARGDRTAAKRPSRAEQEKARRAGHDQTARERLRATVRTAVAAATSTEEFLTILATTDTVHIDIKRFPSGDIRGYKIALNGDTNVQGEPIWFSGSQLAPDLSLPKIRERLNATDA